MGRKAQNTTIHHTICMMNVSKYSIFCQKVSILGVASFTNMSYNT